MATVAHKRLADGLLSAISIAAAALMRHQREGVAAEHKPDASPVTAADREAEEILTKRLAEVAPGVPVLGEEAASEGRAPALGDQYFLIDALDGTKEFISGGIDFTINVAMVERGVPVFGMVYAPAMGRLFGTLGLRRAIEATLQPGQVVGGIDDLGPKEIATSAPASPSFRIAVSRSHLSPETSTFLAQYPSAEVVRIGSSIKFCMVASGEADIYPRFGPTSYWDTAAGHAIVLAAGGAVTTADGAVYEYRQQRAGFLNPSFIAWGRTEMATAWQRSVKG